MIRTNRRSFVDLNFQFNNSVIILTPVEVASKDGQISRVSEFRPFNIKESLDPFGSKDFEVSSLVAVGAFGKLQTTYMSPMSSMNIADSFEYLKFEQDEA